MPIISVLLVAAVVFQGLSKPNNGGLGRTVLIGLVFWMAVSYARFVYRELVWREQMRAFKWTLQSTMGAIKELQADFPTKEQMDPIAEAQRQRLDRQQQIIKAIGFSHRDIST